MAHSNGVSTRASTGFQIGDLVEVRSEEEILATLDANGDYESLPFMPEMLKYCGKRFRVSHKAIKFCDTARWTGFHKMQGAVHLADTRCDGSAHGGCQARCLLYWKEEWLRPVDSRTISEVPLSVSRGVGRGIGKTELMAATRRTADEDTSAGSAGTAYRCQATELVRAGSGHIRWWDVRQYVEDVRAGNAKPLHMVRSVLVMLFNKFQRGNERFFPRWRLFHGGQMYPFISGPLRRTPSQKLNLRPGELVKVKSREEIIATLDQGGRNKGLRFDAEMLKYCGREARVLGRVQQIIDEDTGRMVKFPTDSIILEGVVCTGDYNQYCPRSIYPYWREIWLERVGAPSAHAFSGPDQLGATSTV